MILTGLRHDGMIVACMDGDRMAARWEDCLA
jgi:hypothetical protein